MLWLVGMLAGVVGLVFLIVGILGSSQLSCLAGSICQMSRSDQADTGKSFHQFGQGFSARLADEITLRLRDFGDDRVECTFARKLGCQTLDTRFGHIDALHIGHSQSLSAASIQATVQTHSRHYFKKKDWCEVPTNVVYTGGEIKFWGPPRSHVVTWEKGDQGFGERPDPDIAVLADSRKPGKCFIG